MTPALQLPSIMVASLFDFSTEGEKRVVDRRDWIDVVYGGRHAVSGL